MAEEQTTPQENQDNVDFLTVNKFKKEQGVEKLSVVKNPKTGKLFMDAEGTYFRCQQDLNTELPMRVRIEEGKPEEACLVNVKETESENVVASL